MTATTIKATAAMSRRKNTRAFSHMLCKLTQYESTAMVNSLPMRKGISAILIAVLAFSLTAAFAARPSVPVCCIKAHGCSMLKQAARTCAFAACDQPETFTAAMKQPRAILTEQAVAEEESSSNFEPVIFSVTLTACAAAIDHPPRLLLL